MLLLVLAESGHSLLEVHCDLDQVTSPELPSLNNTIVTTLGAEL